MPTFSAQLPTIRCYRCDGKGILWDHIDDVEFIQACVCIQGPDIAEGMCAVRAVFERQPADATRFMAVDRLLDTGTIADENHRTALAAELASYLADHIDAETDHSRYLCLARFRKQLVTLPVQVKLGPPDERPSSN